MDDFIKPMKIKKYKFIKSLLSNKPTISISIIIVLLICNIAFYSYRVNELLIIKRNSESYMSSGVSNLYIHFKRQKNKLFRKCKNDYKDYCINGICKYIVDLDETVCSCYSGYTGNRCEAYSII
ncbi:SWPV1-259 [Shearwaterpox virus]|uniref:SWPV1-259 n=1 Tax=Shearwaterpox virus TaxID=1974596 RepID=A0A1V0S8B6_CNPV|nr:SWPV1-259 [Shearwaterpox virus]